MPVVCTYDFEVVSVKYFSALGDGDIPLTFLFSGTIFYEGDEENLQVATDLLVEGSNLIVSQSRSGRT